MLVTPRLQFLLAWTGCSLFCANVFASPVDHRDSNQPHHQYGKPIEEVVDLGYAKYKGTILKDAGVNQYLGVRYAAPPLSDLRWRAPQPPLKTKELQNATQYGATCIGLFGPTLSETTNEDCLFLSIYAPSNATTESKLPVWFFIQGGGYAGDTDNNFNGTGVIQASGGNMVFVELNYRVGVFGFLASERVRKEGDLNVGLLDQRAALEWVQTYIHLFGGNPDHVVIHGDSAGAGSVIFHLSAYGGKGDDLGIVGGIAESPFVPTHRTVAESEFQFDRFAANISCSHVPDQMACLRSKDTATLQGSDVALPYPNAPTKVIPDWYWLPVIDGSFSQDYLYRQLERGQFKRVPMMVGNDNDEGTGFSPNATSSAEFLEFVKANYPHLSTHNLEAIKAAYPKGQPQFPNHASWFGPAEEAYGESTLICPGIEIAEAFAKYVSPSKSWSYRYNVEDEASIAGGYGVGHVTEKPAIFGVGNENSCFFGCSYETYNAPMVPIVQSYWVSFIRSLDPNMYKDRTAPVWEPFGHGGHSRLKFELGSTKMEEIPKKQQARCSFWKSLATISEQ